MTDWAPPFFQTPGGGARFGALPSLPLLYPPSRSSLPAYYSLPNSRVPSRLEFAAGGSHQEQHAGGRDSPATAAYHRELKENKARGQRSSVSLYGPGEASNFSSSYYPKGGRLALAPAY